MNPMSTPHSLHGILRGSDDPRTSRTFEGRFGRMFRSLPPAEFADEVEDPVSKQKRKRSSEEILTALAEKMFADSAGDSGIPAGYTYLGQFIDHDLTFDPASSLQRANDPDGLVDYRTPRFDLDCLYGRGPVDQPYLYDQTGGAIRMRLGDPLGTPDKNGNPPPDRDLPRNTDSRAMIGDPRNDENVIIAQLHAIFLRFHNRVAEELKKQNGVEPDFDDVQRLVRWHYQWVILYDFLSRLVDKKIYDEVLPHVALKSDPVQNPPKLNFYEPRDEAYIPIEFSAAAYRFGHSMVRPNYHLNRSGVQEIGGPFDIMGPLVKDAVINDLRGFRRFRLDWAVDWSLFFEGVPPPVPLPENPTDKPLQRAEKIDTALAPPLKNLPFDFTAAQPSLAARNLIRGYKMSLSSGQDVAKAMGARVVPDNKMKVLAEVSTTFEQNAPLWYYVLAEAEHMQGGKRLGAVGSRIVMETFVGLMMWDGHSLLRQNPRWTPWAAFPKSKGFAEGREFHMEHLVIAATGMPAAKATAAGS